MSNHNKPPPSWLQADYLQIILQKSFLNCKQQIKSLKITPGSKEGDNYLCQIFRIDVKLETHTIRMIGKCETDNQMSACAADKYGGIFGSEAKFYLSVLPTLQKFSSIDELIPKCYFADYDRKSLFLEDLSETGFTVPENNALLNRQECVLVIEALASLHGASFHALQNDPDLKTAFAKSIWSSQRFEPLYLYYKNSQASLEKFSPNFGLTKAQEAKLLGMFDKLYQSWFSVCELQEEKLNFIVHGDIWSKNVMFHSTNGSADAVKLLDFQNVNYNSFANDLQYFLFLSADSKVILNDIDFLLERYYDKLQSVAPNIPGLTYERVKREFEERYYYGYLLVLGYRTCVWLKQPLENDELMQGNMVDIGMGEPGFAAEIKKFIPFFESHGVL